MCTVASLRVYNSACHAGLSERQQIALALEESKRTAAAERVHKHQASKKAAKVGHYWPALLQSPQTFVPHNITLHMHCYSSITLPSLDLRAQASIDFRQVVHVLAFKFMLLMKLCAMQESDSDDASDSEQDSVSEDESAVKQHKHTIKAEQPADSLVSQHSDVASQLGKHKHQLCKL